ncbi:MAG: NIPSNAP family protein [Bacteroidota bacterium]
MKSSILCSILLLLGTLLHAQDQVYELRTYKLDFFESADVLHSYFENALIPALNRQGVKNIGAFEATGDALPKNIYLLITYDNIMVFQGTLDKLEADTRYQRDAGHYFKANDRELPDGVTTSLIRSTPGFPQLMKHDDAELFELRIYHSKNEDALRRKVKMFNDSEFVIFDEVGLPMVFFGYNIAGGEMPCLTYLLGFENKAAHAEAWAKFGGHPEWQRILKLEEYAEAMNDIIRVFLKPLPYSQL